jgi:hypothetical protein
MHALALAAMRTAGLLVLLVALVGCAHETAAIWKKQ